MVLHMSIGDGASQHALAEERHFRQALVLDGLHEPLSDGVHVRRANGREHADEDQAEGC
ncbi:MAG: hypothetical protein ACK501_00620 [Planctomycetota bacterium]